MYTLPPPPSSAGVPITCSVMPRSSTSGASASPAPTAAGRDDVVTARVTDHRKRVVLGADREVERSAPDLARERGRQIADAHARPARPASVSAPAVHALDCSSSNFSSGCAWMRWLSATSESRWRVDRRPSGSLGVSRCSPSPVASHRARRRRNDRGALTAQPDRTVLLARLRRLARADRRTGRRRASAARRARRRWPASRRVLGPGRRRERPAGRVPRRARAGRPGVTFAGLYGMEQRHRRRAHRRSARRAVSRRGRGGDRRAGRRAFPPRSSSRSRE